MSRQNGGGGGSGDVARGAGYAAFLGAALIGVAVVIGIVLLQIGDRNDNGPSAAANPGTVKTTSTTKPPKTGTTRPHTTTTVSTPQRPPSAVNVIVLNGGAAAGKASAMTDSLKLKGYTNIGKATDWPGHSQTGNSVYCRAGLEREGTSLAAQLGPNAKSFIPYPASGGPPNSSSHDCVVVVGAPG
jgi:hypothetical protein